MSRTALEVLTSPEPLPDKLPMVGLQLGRPPVMDEQLDQEGHPGFADRIEDLIEPGAENVSTTEVMAFLRSLPRVVRASVVGADPCWSRRRSRSPGTMRLWTRTG